ncbi:MAG TPA: MurR/RpiR family transcriptional regulator [Noviherbaspirillum sp.]|uniref:MurR/RpiR family transcriptional regulator n=1 Tax=Noviherbaspirillum sp. TaxID=1926288 RepID=UPI002B459F45|nr:MurR/RpiR family transcriptional regulator [Noviherbaspirillum sp.]HJV86438.1 MurR/RpiR family transcriptional regulator [Noviherbaspirillum sp.]
MGVINQILDGFSSLSPKLQAAARFVVDHPSEVVIASMRGVAERAGEQPATLVRLAQQLGYAGWPDLKSALAHDLGLHQDSYGQRAKSLAARGRSADLPSELFVAQHQNLKTTEMQCADSLHHAAGLLRRAETVHIAGFRASYPIAYALYYGYRLFRNSVQLIDGQSGGLEMQLRLFEPKDVLVVTSFAPYSRESLLVAEAAKAAGLRIIALTDSQASPLAFDADVTVLFSVTSPSFFPSVVAGVALTEALLELLVADAGKVVAQKIERAEQDLFHSGAYLQAPAKRAGKSA